MNEPASLLTPEPRVPDGSAGSPEQRVAPRCAHFGRCGGCSLQHLSGEAQLELKQRQLHEALERIGAVMPARWLDPLTGPRWQYRRRARLGVRYLARQERALVGFRERCSGRIAQIGHCEVLAEPVDGLCGPLARLVESLSIRAQLPQIEVAVGENAVVLVLRVLETPSVEDLERLRQFGRLHGVHCYLQPGGLDSVQPLQPAPMLRYSVAPAGQAAPPPGAALQLEFAPTDFIQINAEVNAALIGAAGALLELEPTHRLLDLYCGLGNFTLTLAGAVQSAVGVEGEPRLIERARANARRNSIANAQFYCDDLERTTREAPWLGCRPTHMLLDPPRLGAIELLPVIAALRPQRLLYVSCEPRTLARDLGELVHEHGYELLAAGVADMFPHTAHIESLALLAPRS